MNPVSPTPRRDALPRKACPAALLIAGLTWAYWPVLCELARRWAHDPRYSHGFLVPAFASYLLRARRPGAPGPVRADAVGLAGVAAGAALMLFGSFYYFEWVEAASILPSLAGLSALLGGRAGLRRSWPSIAFLLFMIPLPYRAERALGPPMQRVATRGSTFALQALGLDAVGSGNTISLGEFKMGVVDACNGLGLSYMCLACTVGAAVLIPRPRLDKVLFVLSAIPIALLANVTRITATGLLHEMMGKRLADAVYHDLSGWLIMPLVMTLLAAELRALSFLFDEPIAPGPAPAGRGAGVPAPRAPDPEAQSSRTLPALAAVVVVIASGVALRASPNRAGAAGGRATAPDLDRIPMAVGDWRGRNEVMDPRLIAGAGIDGYVLRRYDDERTGRSISLFIACGRPGPISLHTPDVCYLGDGYQLGREGPHKVSLRAARSPVDAEFLSADFVKPKTLTPDRLHICWSWNDGGEWKAPRSPRFAFGHRPRLYKMYVVHRTTGHPRRNADDPCVEFLGQALPEIQKHISQ